MALSLSTVRRALSINPGLAKAHYVLGNLYRLLEMDRDAANLEFERAIALDAYGQDAAYARQNMAWIAATKTGHIDHLIGVFLEDLERNPLNTIDLDNLGFFQLLAGDAGQSAATYRRLFELNPDFSGAHANYALALQALGKSPEALAAAQLESDETAKLRALARLHWPTRRAESDAALKALETQYGDVAAYAVAAVHAYRGEPALAMDWLERAYRQRDSYLEMIKVDPVLTSLRGDPRFHALLRLMKLPD